jgi:hypothetical protein
MSMTIGEVIDALETAKPDLRVVFDFGGVVPSEVASWRGIYEEAALGFEGGDHGHSGEVTAGKLLAHLREVIDGRAYTGWKGGDYRYSRETQLHIDNRGCCTNTELTRVEVGEFDVMLHTEHDEH